MYSKVVQMLGHYVEVMYLVIWILEVALGVPLPRQVNRPRVFRYLIRFPESLLLHPSVLHRHHSR